MPKHISEKENLYAVDFNNLLVVNSLNTEDEYAEIKADIFNGTSLRKAVSNEKITIMFTTDAQFNLFWQTVFVIINIINKK